MIKYIMISMLILLAVETTMSAESSKLEIQVYLHEGENLSDHAARMYIDLRSFSEQDISRFTEIVREWLRNEAFGGQATEKFRVRFIHNASVSTSSNEESLSREE